MNRSFRVIQLVVLVTLAALAPPEIRGQRPGTNGILFVDLLAIRSGDSAAPVITLKSARAVEGRLKEQVPAEHDFGQLLVQLMDGDGRVLEERSHPDPFAPREAANEDGGLEWHRVVLDSAKIFVRFQHHASAERLRVSIKGRSHPLLETRLSP